MPTINIINKKGDGGFLVHSREVATDLIKMLGKDIKQAQENEKKYIMNTKFPKGFMITGELSRQCVGPVTLKGYYLDNGVFQVTKVEK